MRDGWKRVAISDLCIMIKRGQAPSYTESKSVTVLNQKCVRDGRLNLAFSRQTDANLKPVNEWAYLNASDTLVNSTGVGTLGRVAFVRNLSEPTTVDSHVTIVRPDSKKVEPSFLGLSLNFREADIEGLAAGSSGQTELSREALGNLIITLPTLPEQKRIVDLISSVDTYIETLQQQLESAKNSRNAVLHELLTTGSDDWIEHKLIDMFEIYQPQTIAKSLMSEDGEFIVFGANGPIGRYHEFNHDEPEVVVTCRGATCGTINMTPPKTWITGNAMVVSPKTSGVSKEFLYWALIAGVDIQSVISGSAQPQITREGLAPVKIKIPPLSRQVEIVDLISGFELNISHLEESLHKTKTLRSGLLSDLLSGEHEIPVTYDKVMGAA